MPKIHHPPATHDLLETPTGDRLTILELDLQLERAIEENFALRLRVGEALTLDEVNKRLRDAVATAGSQRAWAQNAGVSQQYVADVLNGRRSPGQAILGALGLRAVTVYRSA